jgi:hypothetical protein
VGAKTNFISNSNQFSITHPSNPTNYTLTLPPNYGNPNDIIGLQVPGIMEWSSRITTTGPTGPDGLSYQDTGPTGPVGNTGNTGPEGNIPSRYLSYGHVIINANQALGTSASVISGTYQLLSSNGTYINSSTDNTVKVTNADYYNVMCSSLVRTDEIGYAEQMYHVSVGGTETLLLELREGTTSTGNSPVTIFMSYIVYLNVGEGIRMKFYRIPGSGTTTFEKYTLCLYSMTFH